MLTDIRVGGITPRSTRSITNRNYNSLRVGRVPGRYDVQCMNIKIIIIIGITLLNEEYYNIIIFINKDNHQERKQGRGEKTYFERSAINVLIASKR